MTFEEQVARGEYIHEVNKALTILNGVHKLGGKGVSTEEREVVTKAVSDIEVGLKATGGPAIVKVNYGPQGKSVVLTINDVPIPVILDELRTKGTFSIAFK